MIKASTKESKKPKKYAIKTFNINSLPPFIRNEIDWKDNPHWCKGFSLAKIKNTVGMGIGYFLGTMMFWLCLSLLSNPLFSKFVSEHQYQHLDILLFILIGFSLAMMLYSVFTRSKKCPARLKLQLEPLPGCIGGDAGGVIQLPESFDITIDYWLSIQCVQIDYDRNRMNLSINETIVWKNQGIAEIISHDTNHQLICKFHVPSHLSASQQEDRMIYPCHRWEIHLKSGHLHQVFKIPVICSEPVIYASLPYRYTSDVDS